MPLCTWAATLFQEPTSYGRPGRPSRSGSSCGSRSGDGNGQPIGAGSMGSKPETTVFSVIRNPKPSIIWSKSGGTSPRHFSGPWLPHRQPPFWIGGPLGGSGGLATNARGLTPSSFSWPGSCGRNATPGALGEPTPRCRSSLRRSSIKPIFGLQLAQGTSVVYWRE